MRGLTPEFSAPVPVTVCIIWTRLRHGRLARGSVVCFHDVLLTAVIEGAGGWIFFSSFLRVILAYSVADIMIRFTRVWALRGHNLVLTLF